MITKQEFYTCFYTIPDSVNMTHVKVPKKARASKYEISYFISINTQLNGLTVISGEKAQKTIALKRLLPS